MKALFLKRLITVFIFSIFLLTGACSKMTDSTMNTETKTEANTPTVTLETNMGNIVIALNAEKAPNSAANFISYVESGHYDGTIFHRVINNFMIQGGGFDEMMSQKSVNAPIENEADNGLKNTNGTVAMARTMDPHSATAQFFINVADNGFLNHSAKTPQGWGYAVFGEVVEGMDVVNNIKDQATGTYAGHQDVPKDSIVITKARVN